MTLDIIYIVTNEKAQQYKYLSFHASTSATNCTIRSGLQLHGKVWL
jgi:hypothetical protein